MRTNIDIDDKLLARARKIMGTGSKKETVEEALARVVKRHQQREALKRIAGTGWVGDLDEMRKDEAPVEPLP